MDQLGFLSFGAWSRVDKLIDECSDIGAQEYYDQGCQTKESVNHKVSRFVRSDGLDCEEELLKICQEAYLDGYNEAYQEATGDYGIDYDQREEARQMGITALDWSN